MGKEHSFCRPTLEDGYILYSVHLQLGDVLLEWRKASQQLKRQNAETPEIDAQVVLSFLENFWGDVVQSPTEGLFHTCFAVGRPAEVTQFERSVGDHDILRLNVPMGNMVAMEVVDCPQHLHHPNTHKLFFGIDVVHEHASIDILHQ